SAACGVMSCIVYAWPLCSRCDTRTRDVYCEREKSSAYQRSTEVYGPSRTICHIVTTCRSICRGRQRSGRHYEPRLRRRRVLSSRACGHAGSQMCQMPHESATISCWKTNVKVERTT